MADSNGQWKWSSIEGKLPLQITLHIAATLPHSSIHDCASLGWRWSEDRSESLQNLFPDSLMGQTVWVCAIRPKELHV
ncbi:hypothetical protein V6N13_068210 [Hibiscus sabdariffa]|uniref:Uncharacterized protein n=2 Tax=Hibiscus sabdariffa TaxID=183260 RepID=A0ABR2B1A9_9ROSI